MIKNTLEKNELTQNSWYLYLVREKNNALYCGITTNVQRRFEQHKAGTGAKALKGKMPLTLVFSCLIGSRSDASKMEYQVKKLSKKTKERLVIDQPSELINYLASYNTLSKCDE
ncbi:GIY-YIG nuclease family protein [Providencia sp. Me31A]|uniref:GIY-YIG nuclease family protein n=1 Tax=Providencia sp. Me31A TaxID=3392637 RepID=UPI003D295C83